MKMLGSELERGIDLYITGTWQGTYPLSFTGVILTEKNYSKRHVIREEGCSAYPVITVTEMCSTV